LSNTQLSSVYVPLVTHIGLLLNNTNIIWYGNRIVNQCTQMTTNNIKQNMCYEWRSISAPLMAHVVLLVLQNLLLIMNTDRSGCYNGKRIPAVFVKHELRNVYPLVTLNWFHRFLVAISSLSRRKSSYKMDVLESGINREICISHPGAAAILLH